LGSALTFRKRLLTTGGLGKKLLALGDLERSLVRGTSAVYSVSVPAYSKATETDTLLRIEDGALQLAVSMPISSFNKSRREIAYLPDKALYTTGTTVGLVESKLANDRAAVFPAIFKSNRLATIASVHQNGTGYKCAHFRSFLTFSSSPGSLSAKVSLRD
jgi:hypothetical protein